MRSIKLDEAKKKSRICVEGIKKLHRGIILDSGFEHERGLEDSIYSEAALQRICDSVDYITDPFDMAALAMEAIALNHPFVEGNKRTALAVTLAILNDSGYYLPDGYPTSDFVKEVSMGLHERDEIADWLRNNVI